MGLAKSVEEKEKLRVGIASVINQPDASLHQPRKEANRPCDSAAVLQSCLATLGTPRPVKPAYKRSTIEKETLERFSCQNLAFFLAGRWLRWRAAKNSC